MSSTQTVQMLCRYKAWVNNIIYNMLRQMPHEEVVKQRQTRFGNMIHTLNHVYVNLESGELHRAVHFKFIGGGMGTMTCEEMVLHVVNHATYHRGFVGDMMYQAGVTPRSTDLPVFLRDIKLRGDAWFRQEVSASLEQADRADATWLSHEQVQAEWQAERADLLAHKPL